MACNSEKCHCPACNEERRLKGLEHRVDVLELRESNRDMMSLIDRESARREAMRARREEAFGVSLPVNKRSRQIAKNPQGPVYRGWGFDDDVIWQWTQSKHRADLWRRLNIKTRITFGCPWSSKGRPVTPWGSPMTSGVSAIEHTEHKRVGQIEQTTTDRVEFDVRDYASGPAEFRVVHNPVRRSWVSERFEAKAEDVLRQSRQEGKTEEALREYREVRARRAGLCGDTHIGDFLTPAYPYTHGQKEFVRSLRAAYPRKAAMTPVIIRAVLRVHECCIYDPHPAFRVGFDEAVRRGLLENSFRSYRLTPKGRVFAEAILAVPEPVAAEPEWKMPPRS